MLLDKNSELTGQTYDGFFRQEGEQGASPSGTLSLSETFALPEIRSKDNKFCLPLPRRKFVEENQYASKQCCGNIVCSLAFFG